MTDRPRPDRPMTDFLLEAANNPALHMVLAAEPTRVVNERFGEGSAEAVCLLSGDADAVAEFVLQEHAESDGAGSGLSGSQEPPYTVTVAEGPPGGSIRLLICVTPN